MFVLGDMNVDGWLNFGDINPFVLAMSDPTTYMREFKVHPVIRGDINSDGVLDFADINPFVALLTG